MAENSIVSELNYVREVGSLQFRDVRYLLIRPETLAAFQKAVEEDVGIERAGEILFAGGFTGGQLSGKKYKETFNLTDREAVDFMCKMGGEIGWGRFRLVALNSETQHLIVEVDRSPFAEAYIGKSDTGVCHLIRGVLGGLVSGIFGAEVRAHESRCFANGDESCRFEIRTKQMP